MSGSRASADRSGSGNKPGVLYSCHRTVLGWLPPCPWPGRVGGEGTAHVNCCNPEGWFPSCSHPLLHFLLYNQASPCRSMTLHYSVISLGRGDFCLVFALIFLKLSSLDTWGGSWCLEVTCSSPGQRFSWGAQAIGWHACWLQLGAGMMPLVSSWRCCYQNSSTLSIKCCKHLLC